MFPLDRAVFHTINGWPDGLDPLFRFFSNGIHDWPLRIALAILVVAMVARGGKPRATVTQALLAWLCSEVVTNHILKSFFFTNRPCDELTDAILRNGHMGSSGTASSHAASMAAVATVWMFRLGPKWGSIWVVIALLTGFSRVYMAAHYPAQVVLGWIVGALMGLLVVKVWDSILLHRTNVSITNGDPDTDTED